MNTFRDMNMIDIVIYYLNIVNTHEEINENFTVNKRSAKYLLGQTIRQLNLPREKYYLSVEAKKKWNLIRKDNEDIFKYWYRNSVEKNVESIVEIAKYKGGEKLPYKIEEISCGDKFIFKDVFHDDHIIPIKLILKKLLKIKEVNRKNVTEILEDISVCRMLKSEDRLIYEKSKREYSEIEIINKLYYNDYEIKIVGFDYTAQQ